MSKQHEAYSQILAAAHAAGNQAGNSHNPRPMTVLGSNGYREVVNDGVCGFAYVGIRPGTSSFAKWLVKNGYARKSYYGGVEISIHEYNQSLERKEAHARAMAASLREHGINASARSMMD